MRRKRVLDDPLRRYAGGRRVAGPEARGRAEGKEEQVSKWPCAGRIGRLVVCATCVACTAVGVWAIAAAAEASWARRDFESPLGDRASGIAVAAEQEPGFSLVIGCDGERGDRWRGVAIIQQPGGKRELEEPVGGPTPRARVNVALGDGPQVSDTFEIRRNPAGAQVLWIPEPSKFVRRLLDEEKRTPASGLRVKLFLASGKPLELRFPLAGIEVQFADLSERCRDWQP